MPALVTGRQSFPLEALRHCVPADGGDLEVIVRSMVLRAGFHGLVELQAVTEAGLELLRRAGWKVYDPEAKALKGL